MPTDLVPTQFIGNSCGSIVCSCRHTVGHHTKSNSESTELTTFITAQNKPFNSLLSRLFQGWKVNFPQPQEKTTPSSPLGKVFCVLSLQFTPMTLERIFCYKLPYIICPEQPGLKTVIASILIFQLWKLEESLILVDNNELILQNRLQHYK